MVYTPSRWPALSLGWSKSFLKVVYDFIAVLMDIFLRILACKSCDRKYVDETKRLLETRVREHRDEVEKIGDGYTFH